MTTFDLLKPPAIPTYRGGLGAARLRRVAEFIQAGLERDLTLVDLAQSVGLSTAHFAVMFRQSTGETPHQFVLRCRMERAKEMLRMGKLRIVDVAVACGFKTQQHFARVFRQMCGVAPREYRSALDERLSTPASEQGMLQQISRSESIGHTMAVGS
jgi:AraC family transcriptional regulator